MTNKKTRKICSTALLGFLLILVSCDNGDSIRSYEEKTPPATTESKATKSQLNWDTPEGWVQEKNTSSMRLATFTIGEGDDRSICTIVPLKGEAGGLKANVARWLGQLKIRLQSEEELMQFLDQKRSFITKGQFSGQLMDFTSLSEKPDDMSMIVAMVTISDTTLFVKMSGLKKKLIASRSEFESLCESINTGTI